MISSTRKKGKRGSKKVNHQEDRLSNLPDEFLIKILSCLGTREAVRSGILSTRWKSVWALVPVLDLSQYDDDDDDDVDNQRDDGRFFNFMEQVLIARRFPCLEKVRILVDRCDPYLLRSWVRAALVRNTNDLDIADFGELGNDITCELTNSLFSHNKLVILKLQTDIILNFQANSSAFPSLKFLLLHSIRYKDDDSLPNLLSSCPILEDLVIHHGEEDSLATINLISRSVKRFKFICFYCPIKMVFDAPAVESLSIRCTGEKEFLVKDFSRIVDADFENLELHSDAYKLLRGVSNVRFLRLTDCTIETIERPNAYNFPMFNNLNRLVIHRFSCGLIKNVQWKLLLEILKCSPNLENLIYQVIEHGGISQEDGKASDWNVPSCVVSSLKTIEFNRFSESDVERVRYFLRNALVLEIMTIRHDCLFSEELKSELCNAIFEKKKGSATVTWSEKETIISSRYLPA